MNEALLNLKAKLKKIRKNFKRTEWNKRKKLGTKWRRAKGRDNKIRRGLDGYKVKAGYGTPNEIKGLHPRGLKEAIVNNMEELKIVDKKKYVVRIASGVGLRKREEMLKYAKEKGIHILNASLKAKKQKRSKKAETLALKEKKRKEKEKKLKEEEKAKTETEKSKEDKEVKDKAKEEAKKENKSEKSLKSKGSGKSKGKDSGKTKPVSKRSDDASSKKSTEKNKSGK